MGVQDAEGSWHTGAIAAVVDCVCSAVVHTVVGAPTATVHYSLSYFSPADRDVRMFRLTFYFLSDYPQLWSWNAHRELRPASIADGGGGGGASGEPEGEADGCDG